MAETLRCSVSDCGESAAGSLEGHSFCREHFISSCFEQLDQCKRWQEARLSPDRTPETVRQFLVECYRQVADLVRNVQEFTSLERAQLLGILLRATDLSCRLRQSPRLAASVPVELRCEEPGGAWEEETRTKLLGPHGALLKCQHPVRAGEILLVVRMDTGRQVQARVARRQRKIGGAQEIGIEFLDRDNLEHGLEFRRLMASIVTVGDLSCFSNPARFATQEKQAPSSSYQINGSGLA